MKLVTFTHAGKTRIGAVLAEEVVDVSGQGRNVPSEMVAFLEQGAPALEQAREACASGRGRLALADVQLEAPIRRPPKILAVGLNYRDHIEETDAMRLGHKRETDGGDRQANTHEEHVHRQHPEIVGPAPVAGNRLRPPRGEDFPSRHEDEHAGKHAQADQRLVCEQGIAHGRAAP